MNDQQFNRNAILAKSPPGQRSLFDHLQDCLGIFKQLKIALPALPRCAGDTFFWDMLFLAVYLHDWGKACSGFQQQLQPDGKRWGERHERFSAAFVALASLDERKQQQVGRAILGHHKTFDKLRELRIRIKAQEDGILDLDFIRAETSFAQQIEDIDKNYIRFLKNQLPDVSMRFHPQNRIQTQTIQFSQLQDPLDILLDFWLKKAPESHSQVFWLEMLLCGATKMCDHLGSARMENIPVLTQDDFQFMQRIQPYVHQKNCWQTTGHAFLTAPTGSGKTEAALGWIQLQLAREQGRVFYILPYTASINAMQQRLAQILTPEQSFESSELVGLLHGKARLHLLSAFDERSAETEDAIRKMIDVLRKMQHPIKIVTPFQILKHAFGVRGFEIGLTELAGSVLVFDEIHAYDSETFARIVVLLKWLNSHLAIRVLIMTATMPKFLHAKLKKILQNSSNIGVEPKFLQKLKRHYLRIFDGKIEEQTKAIREILKSSNSKVMVVCNTVAKAQILYEALKEDVDENQRILLHGRFTYEDRFKKEQALSKSNTRLLVGTQTVEVSLDIDFDVLFTEPAPIDALLQRFGRINRHNPQKKGLRDVVVCSVPGDYDFYIYNREIVAKTLEVIKQGPLDESLLQNWIDSVYPCWPEELERQYQQTFTAFENLLCKLYPYRDHHATEEEFEQLFDGIPLLPAVLQQRYDDLLQNGQFIESETLLVSVRKSKFAHLMQEDRIRPHQVDLGEKLSHKIYIVDCEYSFEFGLTDETDSENLVNNAFL